MTPSQMEVHPDCRGRLLQLLREILPTVTVSKGTSVDTRALRGLSDATAVLPAELRKSTRSGFLTSPFKILYLVFSKRR